MSAWTNLWIFVGLVYIVLANSPVRQEELITRNIFRLVDSARRNEGRVEVFHNGVWGTVCSSHQPFGVAEAYLVCHTLGFRNGGTPVYGATYGFGRGKIWLENLDCPWEANDLGDCLHNPWGSTTTCTHADDVGIVCNLQPVQDLAVRLIGGNSPNEGRLQVSRDGVWGALCNLGYTTSWDPRDAAVICRQLGYNFGGEALLWNVNDLGAMQRGTPTWISPLYCGGKEPNLGHCPDLELQVAPRACTRPSTSISLKCYNQTISDFQVRIHSGDSDYSGSNGTVNVFHNGNWYNICDDWWGDDDARAVCKTLGFSNGRATHLQLQSTHYGFGWDMVYCPHRTSDFSRCYHRGWGLHTCHWYEMAGVECV